MNKFTNWGTAMKSLDATIAHHARRIWDATEPYDRPKKYYARELFIISHAFQCWCEDHGIDPIKLRDEMTIRYHLGHMEGLMDNMRMKKLLDYIPNEFYVRGKWMPLENCSHHTGQ